MTVSIAELMRCVRHYFVTGALDGAWRIEGGLLAGDAPVPAGWIAAEGAGVFRVDGEGRVTDPDGAPDRAWDGPLWLLDPPDDFLRLHGEINDWLAQQGSAAGAGIARRRESFGAYATETEYADAASGSWERAFAGRLLPYRRMFPEVNA